jgi:predicted ATP-grasp superfamily ATP-dependent carboligase
VTNTLQVQFVLLSVLYRKVCPVGSIAAISLIVASNGCSKMGSLRFQFFKKVSEVVRGKSGHGRPASERGYSSNLALPLTQLKL